MPLVHFSITGEFITRHARSLWQERSFAKAYDTLECVMGTTRDQHDDVLQGRMKFTGTNQLTLESDTWTPPKGYPTPRDLLLQAAAFPELEDRRQDEARQILTNAAKLTGHWASDEDKAEAELLIAAASRLIGHDEALAELANICAEPEMISEHSMFAIRPDHRSPRARKIAELPEFKDIGLGDCRGSEDIMASVAARAQETLRRMAMKKEGFDPDVMPSTDALLHRGHNLTPTLCPDMSSVNGWLLPDGKFYGCGTMEHIGLVENLLKDKVANLSDAEDHAESLGWIKLARSFTGFHCIARKKPTKRQLTKLWDYAQKHDRDYEELIRWLPTSNL